MRQGATSLDRGLADGAHCVILWSQGAQACALPLDNPLFGRSIVSRRMTGPALLTLALLGALGSGASAQQTPLQRHSPEADKRLQRLKIAAFVPQVGHSRALSDMAYSPDGKLLATASGLDDGLVKVWEVATGRLLHTLAAEDYVSFSADGAWLATGEVGGPVLIWEVATGKLHKTLQASGPVAYSPDGKVLVAEAVDKDGPTGKLMRFALPGYEPLAPIEGHKASWTALSISANGRFAATTSYDEAIKVWDLHKGELVRTLKAHPWVAQAVALSPDGEQLAVAYGGVQQTQIQLWAVGASRVQRELKGLAGDVTSLHYAPDGASLVSASLDHQVRVWRVSDGQVLATHKSRGLARFSPDGATIAHGERQVTLTSQGGAASVTLPENATSMFEVAFDAKAESFVTSDSMSQLDRWDARTGKLLGSVAIPNGSPSAPLGELILSPSGAMVARRPFEGKTLALFDAATGQARATIQVPDANAVRSVTFSPQESELIIESVTGDDDEQTTLLWWDLAANQAMARTTIEGFARVHGFVDDGKNVAIVSHGGASSSARLSARIWDRDSGLLNPVRVKDIPPYAGDVAFCPTGTLVALGDQDSTVKIFDRATNQIVATLSGHSALVNQITCSPDGKLLATGGWDEQVHVWSLPEGKRLVSLDDAHYKAQRFAFSPEGRQLLIAHKGWTRHLHVPSGHSRTIYRVGPKGWMVHDSRGQFDCAEGGCALPAWRAQSGQLMLADDKALPKALRGLKPL